MAIAAAAHYAATHVDRPIHWREVLDQLRGHVTEQELLDRIDRVEHHLELGSPPEVLAAEIGLTRGVTGYINNTVPIRTILLAAIFG